jgi:hypothetical protein
MRRLRAITRLVVGDESLTFDSCWGCSFYYKKAEDTYYQANNWAAYDDWRRARDQWDYFYSRALPAPLPAVNATV